MSVHHPNTLQALKAYVRAFGALDNMPPEVACSILLANNRILAAAVIENGGELNISSNSIHEILTPASHVMAVAAKDGSLKITVDSKDEIIAKSGALAL